MSIIIMDKDYSKYTKEDLIKIVKKLENKNIRLKEISSIDALTNVKNRREFDNLAKYLQNKEKYPKQNRRKRKNAGGRYIIFLDLNDFGKLNKSRKYGYDIADQNLRVFASYLKNNFRKQDEIFRYGGDEFIVVMKDGFTENILEDKLNDIREKFNVSYGYEKIGDRYKFDEAYEIAKDKMKDMKENTTQPYNLFNSQ